MLSRHEGEAAFLAARAAVDRSAWRRWLEVKGVDPKNREAASAALATWRQAHLLGNPHLVELAHQALQEARGRVPTGTERFPAALWLGGAEDTRCGRQFLGTVADFVKVLRERATKVAPKRAGWVIEPTTNPEGRRTNEKTLAVHALFLDCDDTGSWDQLLGQLDALDYCYIAYQSGGWTPTTPKWRVVIPLHAPHDTKAEGGVEAWKSAYNHARVVFGAVAGLRSVGFDPATETPCCPWFLTEKRDPKDPERQIIWRPGHALDLTALVLALPEVPVETHDHEVRGAPAELALEDDKLGVIIDALAAVTSNVPTGRRDLYLALPGALLDRGIAPDDVIAIVEGVSLAYPRRHADKHADNMHNCKTTIARWEAKTTYTRIGTLQSVAPTVAAVVDQFLPDRAAKAIEESTEAMLRPQLATITPETAPLVIEHAVEAARRPRGKLTDIQREALEVAAYFRRIKKRHLANLVECAAKCSPILATVEASIDKQVALLMDALGQRMPTTREWPEILDMCNPSLLDFAFSKERVAAAERVFYVGRGKKNKRKMKRESRREEERQSRAREMGKIR